MCRMRLGETNKLSMDQVMYYLYQTYYYMEQHNQNINNTHILLPKGHQVTHITKDDEVEQDSFDSVSEY